MKNKTENCIMCGRPAVLWCGHVIGYKEYNVENLEEVKVIAGFCRECYEIEAKKQEFGGYYGRYDKRIMGNCLSVAKIN